MTDSNSALTNLSEAINNPDSSDAPNSGAGTGNTIKSNNWLDSLPDDLKNNKSLSKFTGSDMLAKSYLELERNYNKRIAIPEDTASDDEWSKLYRRLGMPDDKKYISDERRQELLKSNIADDDTLNAYETLFANSGLTKRQSEKALTQIIENVQNSNKHYQEIKAKETADNMQKFSEKYGKNSTEKLNILKATMAKHGSDELVSLIEESNYAPVLIELLIKLGEVNKSDSLIAGSTPRVVTGKDNAKKEIKRLESDKEFMLKYLDKNHAGHDDAKEKMKALYEEAYDK